MLVGLQVESGLAPMGQDWLDRCVAFKLQFRLKCAPRGMCSGAQAEERVLAGACTFHD